MRKKKKNAKIKMQNKNIDGRPKNIHPEDLVKSGLLTGCINLIPAKFNWEYMFYMRMN